MNLSGNSFGLSGKVIRIVGYGLLTLWILDAIAIFIPPRFTDPTWEFETMGRLVESVGWPLLAMAFIFFGEEESRPRFELILVKGLSWFCLVLAIFYFLMLPLGLANSWRIKNRNDVQIGEILSQKTTPLNQLETGLTKASSNDDVTKVLLSLIPPDRRAAQAPQIKDPQDVKTKLLSEIVKSKQKLKTETDDARSNYLKVLIKNAVKWNMGAILSGVLFIYLWRFSKDIAVGGGGKQLW